MAGYLGKDPFVYIPAYKTTIGFNLMSQAQRKTIGDTLLDQLQELVDHPDRVTDFALRRIEREVERLAQVDPVQAGTIKAALGVCRWDTEAVHYWTKNVLLLERSSVTLVNASASKALIGSFHESAELAMEAFELVSRDARLAQHVCHCLMLDARYQDVLDVSSKFVPEHEYFSSVFSQAENALVCMSKLGIDEKEVRSKVEVAASVAAGRKVRILRVDPSLLSDFENEDTFVVSLGFIGDIRDEIALDEALVDQLLDDPTWEPLKLSVEFGYLRQDELQPW